LRIDFNRFDLPDVRKGNDNATHNNSIARYSVMLEGPAITQELGSEVPLFSPISLQTLSSFFIADGRAAVFLSKQIESTSVDKGITTDWVFGEIRKVEWDCEREFK